MQIGINILYSASIILLAGLGFVLIYRVTRFFHFAHAFFVSLSPYLALVLVQRAGLSLLAAIPVAVVFSAALACCLDLSVYRPLRRRGATPLVLLLASLGSYMALQNLVSMVFGDATKMLTASGGISSWHIVGTRVAPIQAVTLLVAVVTVTGTGIFLGHTEAGKRIRAVADNQVLAEISGLAAERVILQAFAIGTLPAAALGILLAVDVGMTPTMGMMPLMLGVVAAVVGGTSRVCGIVIGALLIATCQQLAVWFLGARWQEAAAFAVLLVFLIVRRDAFTISSPKSDG